MSLPQGQCFAACAFGEHADRDTGGERCFGPPDGASVCLAPVDGKRADHPDDRPDNRHAKDFLFRHVVNRARKCHHHQHGIGIVEMIRIDDQWTRGRNALKMLEVKTEQGAHDREQSRPDDASWVSAQCMPLNIHDPNLTRWFWPW